MFGGHCVHQGDNHIYTGVCVLKFSKLKNVTNDFGKRQ